MLLEAFGNILLLIVLPAGAGAAVVLQILCHYRDRQITLHERLREAIQLRREYEGDAASVHDLLEY